MPDLAIVSRWVTRSTLGHTNTGITNGEDVAGLVWGDANVHFRLSLELARIGKRCSELCRGR